jgi:hypothetical protein
MPVLAQEGGIEPPEVEDEEAAKTVWVVDDGFSVRTVWLTPDGVVHEWVYYYAGTDEYPAGTAYHAVYLPFDVEEPPEGGKWSGLQEFDFDGDGELDGKFYRMAHSVPPMAVIAQARGADLDTETLVSLMALARPGLTPGWLRHRAQVESRGDLQELGAQVREWAWRQHPQGEPPGLARRDGQVPPDDDASEGDGEAGSATLASRNESTGPGNGNGRPAEQRPAQPPAGPPSQPPAGPPAQPPAGPPAQPPAGPPSQPPAGPPAQPPGQGRGSGR